MKKYLKKIIVLIIQLIMFYLFPLAAGPTDTIGMIIILIFSVIILSIIIGAISKEKIKYLYPIVVYLLFIPSVFIYYNETALIYALWYLIIAYIGLLIGTILKKLIIKD